MRKIMADLLVCHYFYIWDYSTNDNDVGFDEYFPRQKSLGKTRHACMFLVMATMLKFTGQQNFW